MAEKTMDERMAALPEWAKLAAEAIATETDCCESSSSLLLAEMILKYLDAALEPLYKYRSDIGDRPYESGYVQGLSERKAWHYNDLFLKDGQLVEEFDSDGDCEVSIIECEQCGDEFESDAVEAALGWVPPTPAPERSK